MSFTDQKPRVATNKDVVAPWGGGKYGIYFRCYLCGYKFTVGDYFRWVFHSTGNFLTCKDCDCIGVAQKWEQVQEEAIHKYWWFTKR